MITVIWSPLGTHDMQSRFQEKNRVLIALTLFHEWTEIPLISKLRVLLTLTVSSDRSLLQQRPIYAMLDLLPSTQCWHLVRRAWRTLLGFNNEALASEYGRTRVRSIILATVADWYWPTKSLSQWAVRAAIKGWFVFMVSAQTLL